MHIHISIIVLFTITLVINFVVNYFNVLLTIAASVLYYILLRENLKIY